jgi:MFS family permease
VTEGPERLLSRTFVILVAAHFLHATGNAALLLLPLFLDNLGATRTEIGAMMAAAAVGGLATRPFVGWAIDRLGRRPTLFFGNAVLGLSMAGLLLVEELGPIVYVLRVLQGIGLGANFTAFFAFAADTVPESRRTEGLALFGVSGLIPLAVNSLVDRVGVDPAGLRYVYPLIGATMALAIFFVWLLPEPSVRRVSSTSPEGGISSAVRAIVHRDLHSTWLAAFIIGSIFAVFSSFSTVAAASRGVAHPADLWFAFAAAAVVVRLFGGRVPDRVGTHNLVAPATATYAVAMVLVANANDSSAFVIAGALAGIGHGYAFPVLATQVVSRIPDRLRGSGVAMFTALFEVAFLLVPPAMGKLADARGDRAMFATSSAVTVLALAAWAAVEHRRVTRRGRVRPT